MEGRSTPRPKERPRASLPNNDPRSRSGVIPGPQSFLHLAGADNRLQLTRNSFTLPEHPVIDAGEQSLLPRDTVHLRERLWQWAWGQASRAKSHRKESAFACGSDYIVCVRRRGKDISVKEAFYRVNRTRRTRLAPQDLQVQGQVHSFLISPVSLSWLLSRTQNPLSAR